MSLLEQLKPLVLGPWVRALAIYIEIVTFGLTLPAGWGILDVCSFAVLGVVWITDVVLCVRARKAQKVSRLLGTKVENKPNVGVIIFDMVAGVLFLFSCGAYMYWGIVRDSDSYHYYNAYSVIWAFVLVGDLAIAHIHIFMGSILAHTLRQQKNGQIAARRAHSREQSRHGADTTVELAEPVESVNQPRQVV